MLNGKPLCIDVYAGLGGWSDGFLEAGYTVIGFDIQRHVYGEKRYPGQLVQYDALTMHGSMFQDADCLVMSPPCQAYSWLAQPWSRSKCPLCKGKNHYFAWQLERGIAPAHMTNWGDPIPCDCEENSKAAKELRRKWEIEGPDNRLFDACFRIQREAIAATQKTCKLCAGTGNEEDDPEYGTPGYTCGTCGGLGWTERRYIPLIVENVRGAVPWVGKRDMPLDQWLQLSQAEKIERGRPNATFGSFYLFGDVACIGNRVVAGRDLADIRAGRGRFGMGVAPEKATKFNPDGTTHPQGSWFRIADSSQGDRGQKVPGFLFDGSGRSFQTASVEASGVKVASAEGRRTDVGNGARFTTRDCGVEREGGTKIGGDWFSDPNSTCCKHGSRSNARKAASALIARIPPALSAYVAAQHFPK